MQPLRSVKTRQSKQGNTSRKSFIRGIKALRRRLSKEEKVFHLQFHCPRSRKPLLSFSFLHFFSRILTRFAVAGWVLNACGTNSASFLLSSSILSLLRRSMLACGLL